MISLDRVAARRAPMTLSDVSAQWGPGVHSIVGAPSDGTSLLLGLLSGTDAPRSGAIRVLDGAPTDRAIARQIGRILLDTPLAEPLRVDETLSLAAKIRGDAPTDARERLAALGVEALAGRTARSLSPDEARAACAAEALTSPSVRAVLFMEPLVSMDPRAARRVGEALRSAARAGKCVLVATSSLRDAGELADDHVLLRNGRVVFRSASIEELYGLSARGAYLRVFTRNDDGARALAADLARLSEVTSLDRSGTSVTLGGESLKALADAVGRAAVAADVEVTEMWPEGGSPAEGRAPEGGP